MQKTNFKLKLCKLWGIALIILAIIQAFFDWLLTYWQREFVDSLALIQEDKFWLMVLMWLPLIFVVEFFLYGLYPWLKMQFSQTLRIYQTIANGNKLQDATILAPDFIGIFL